MATTFSTHLKSINPATLEVLAEVPMTQKAAVLEALEASRIAFKKWSSLPLWLRLSKIEKFSQLLLDKKDEIANLISRESGKPILESYLAELSGPLDTCDWLSKKAQKLLANKRLHLNNPLLFGKTHYLQFEPVGVVGIISPWNYPFSIPVMTILMALAAGNTVILKPSEKTPLVGLKIAELFQQAGFSENVVTVISGDGEIGKELSALPLDRLIFTGSVATGEKVLNTVAPNITPVSLELGGKDAAIVLADAPVERTARAIVWGAFTNAGQACASIERLYLVRGKNSDALLNRIIELTSQLKVGNPLLETTDVGPLIDVQQFDRIVEQVEQADSAGAEILCGGENLAHLGSALKEKGLTGYYYQPTVLTNVNHNMKIMQEESFGPVLPVMVVDSVDEAIKLANDSIYGLSASIWSKNLSQAEKIAGRLEVGTVFINDSLYSHAATDLPWGGIKKSGIGRSHSYFGLLDLVNVKNINVDSALWFSRLWWYPYHSAKLKVICSGFELLYGKKISNKMGAFLDFIANLFRSK